MPQTFFPDKETMIRVKSVDRPGYVYIVAIGSEVGITEKVLKVLVEIDGKLLGPRGATFPINTTDFINVYEAGLEILSDKSNGGVFRGLSDIASGRGVMINEIIKIALAEYVKKQSVERVQRANPSPFASRTPDINKVYKE